MNHAATTASLTASAALKPRLLRYSFHISVSRFRRICVIPRGSRNSILSAIKRLSRERLSNGSSLRFARRSRVRKSAESQTGDARRSTRREDDSPRIIAAPARLSRADNARRRTITPIKMTLGYRISTVASILLSFHGHGRWISQRS